MHGSEGRGTVAGVGVEGDSVERVDVRCVVVPEGLADARRRWRGGDISVGGENDLFFVDVAGVLEFDVEVVLPAVVDGGVGNAGGVELGGEGYAGTVEREGVVGEDDTESCHDRDEEDAGDGDAVVNLLLVVAGEAEDENDQRAEHVAVEEKIGGSGKEQQRVDEGVGAEEDGQLLPGDGGIGGGNGGEFGGALAGEGCEKAEKTSDGDDGDEDLQAGVDEDGRLALEVSAFVDAVNADPAAASSGSGFEEEVRMRVAHVDGEQKVNDGGDRDDDADARAALPDLGKEEGEEGEEKKGDVEEGVDELADGVSEGKDFGKEVLGNGVGLALEPLQAGKDEERAGEGCGGSGEENAAAGAQEPKGGGQHDEDAEPGDLARGSEDGVGEDGDAEPGDDTAIGRGLQRSETAVEADHDGEEAGDVGEEGCGEDEVERRENEGEGSEGGVALGDIGADENALQNEGHDDSNEDGAHANDGVGEAEELDEGGGEDKLPDEHGCGPSGVEDVAGGGKGVGHHDVGAVIGDSHLCEGVADELAEEHGQRAEDGGNAEPSDGVQRTP